ncbi:MAG: hypothetical protein HYU99_07200 [Deltaproteobacteria bacterium]|nr:hypothetical protein [Deltaproteobacteria bacterium]
MTKTAVTAIKMLESLPEMIQERVADRLREYVEEERDEVKWDRAFKRKGKFAGLINKAQKEIREGKAVDMDYEKL